MKAKILKQIIDEIPDEADVYFRPKYSDYPEDFADKTPEEKTINSFYGDKTKGYIITSEGQVGGV